jgi:hemoglobin/transferrin/lactoferrin receptor protein
MKALHQIRGKALFRGFLIIFILIGWLGISRPMLAQSTLRLPEQSGSSETKIYKLKEVEVEDSQSDSGRSFLGKFIEHELDDEDIQNQQSNTVSDLVDQVPGVDNIGGPRKESQQITIRGFQPNQILFLLDGTRQNFQMTHNSIIPVRNHLLKRLDIMKGGASSRFGNGALGGLVNFTTMDARDFLTTTENRSLALRSQYQSNSNARQYSLTNGLLFNKSGNAGALVDVTQSQASNIVQSDGEELTFSGYEDQSLWLKTHFEIGKGHQFWITAEEQTKDSATPFNPTGDVFTPRDVAEQTEEFRNLRGQYKLTHRSYRYRPEVTIYNAQTEMQRVRRVDGRTDNRVMSTTGFVYHSTLDLLRSSQNFHLDLQPGFEIYRDSSEGKRDDGELSNFPDGESFHQGVYLQGNLVYHDWLWVQTGARYDEVELSGRSIDGERKSSGFSPELEVGFQMNDNAAFSVSYEEGYNAPEIRQIYPSGVHFPTGPFSTNDFVPNPDLVPEESDTVEAKLLLDWQAVANDEGSMTVSVYRTRTQNFVDQNVDLVNNTTQFVNRGLVEHQGYEVYAEQEVGAISFGTSYTHVRALKVFENQPLSQAPADQWAANIKYRKDKWSVGLQRQEFFKQDRLDRTNDFINVQETPGFELYNVYLNHRLIWHSYATDFRLRANNVMDVKHRRHGTPLLGPARDIRFEMKIAL